MAEVRINVTGAHRSQARYDIWPMKSYAATALGALRGRGRNIEDCVRIHPAYDRFGRFWVIARPDPDGEMTWLMAKDGAWVRGRLYDAWTEAVWRHMPPADGQHLPATFTHVTRTVPYHDRTERYRTKSNGASGRWVRSDDSVALCVCGWSSHASTRDEARASARAHRTEDRWAHIAPNTEAA